MDCWDRELFEASFGLSPADGWRLAVTKTETAG
jgi:hypothetical protein